MSRDIETIHDDMLMAISNDYQKSPGYPTYDYTRAFALGCASLSEDIDAAEARQDVFNLTGDDLARYVYQYRGLTRKSGTKATAEIKIISGSGTITEGDLFATLSGVVFEATETKTVVDNDYVALRAVESGTASNVAANTITQVPVTIVGITSFTNPEPASGGTSDESDAELLERFLENLRYPDNGCNKQAYINWATSIDGVGRAKCFPLAYGPDTVEVCITDSDMGVPIADIIAEVQDYIDPEPHGTGAGRAPVGAFCTVTGGVGKTIDVTATLSIASGYTRDSVQAAVEAKLDEYLRGIAFYRIDESQYQSYVSYAKIGECIMETDGVLDYTGLTVNGGTASVQLGDREIPVLGMVTLL